MTSLFASALVVLSAILHACWNALIKASPLKSTGVAVLTFSGIQAIACSILLRTEAFPDPSGVGWSLLSGMVESVYFLTLVWSLSLGPLAQVYSFSRGGSLLFIWPLSMILMGEPMVALHALGAATVFLGLLLTGLTSQTDKTSPHSAAYFMGLTLCAASVAAYHLCYKKAILTGAHPLAVFATSMLIAVPVNLFWHRKLLAQEWRRLPWKWVSVASTLCTLSFLLALAALETAGAGWVLTLRNCSVVVALLLAWKLGEKITPHRAWGALLITLGAIVLSWPIKG